MIEKPIGFCPVCGAEIIEERARSEINFENRGESWVDGICENGHIVEEY